MGGKPVKSQKLKIISEIDPIYDSKDWRLKKLRACAYIRVSTDSHDQENSLKNQRAHYEKFIAQFPNWEYVGIFADEYTSYGQNPKRPWIPTISVFTGVFIIQSLLTLPT